MKYYRIHYTIFITRQSVLMFKFLCNKRNKNMKKMFDKIKY